MDTHRADSPQNYKQLSRRPDGLIPPLHLNPALIKTPCVGFVSRRTTRRALRSDMLGVVEAAYLMVKCFRRALRVCNTVVKIDEFHTDSNFSCRHSQKHHPKWLISQSICM